MSESNVGEKQILEKLCGYWYHGKKEGEEEARNRQKSSCLRKKMFEKLAHTHASRPFSYKVQEQSCAESDIDQHGASSRFFLFGSSTHAENDGSRPCILCWTHTQIHNHIHTDFQYESAENESLSLSLFIDISNEREKVHWVVRCLVTEYHLVVFWLSLCVARNSLFLFVDYSLYAPLSCFHLSPLQFFSFFKQTHMYCTLVHE